MEYAFEGYLVIMEPFSAEGNVCVFFAPAEQNNSAAPSDIIH